MGRLEETGRRSIGARWWSLALSLTLVIVAIAFEPIAGRLGLAQVATFGMLVGLDVGALLFGYHLERGGK